MPLPYYIEWTSQHTDADGNVTDQGNSLRCGDGLSVAIIAASVISRSPEFGVVRVCDVHGNVVVRLKDGQSVAVDTGTAWGEVSP